MLVYNVLKVMPIVPSPATFYDRERPIGYRIALAPVAFPVERFYVTTNAPVRPIMYL
jgi:hypothetical protein